MKKVVLAYSGGLDTQVAVKWLTDKGFGVICFVADLGQGLDVSALKKKAKKAGALKLIVKDLKNEFINDFIFASLKANALYEGKYPLATALARPLIAKYLVEVAKKENAKFVAHGCTGKGNDQVRFEVTIGILAPQLEIIAPAREWEFPSREAEIRFAKQHGIPVEATKKSPYSIDMNLWGVSIECGSLEDAGIEPPEDAYQITKSPIDAPNKPTYVNLHFEKGVPVKLNGKTLSGLELISRLNKIGSENGVGRIDLVEDRLVGIKSREIYEAPAATILIEAHKSLENMTLDREVLHFKELISQKYSQLVYYGLWYTQLKSALDGFIDQTQKNVTGDAKIKLYKGNCFCVGRVSKFSLYKKELASYKDLPAGKAGMSKFDQKLAEGFIKIWGLPYKGVK